MNGPAILYTTEAERRAVSSALDKVRYDIDLVRTASISRVGEHGFKAMGRSFTLTPEKTVGVPSLRLASFYEKDFGGPNEPVLSAAIPFMERRPGKAIQMEALRLLRETQSALELLLSPEHLAASTAARRRVEDVGMAIAARVETAPPPICAGRDPTDFWLDHPGPSGRSEFCVRLEPRPGHELRGWTVVSEGADLSPALEALPRVDFVWITDRSTAATPVGDNAWGIELRPVPVTGTLGGDPVSTIAALRLDVPSISWSRPRSRD